MPTPVNIARQCLTPEAAHALDEAVAVARRRGHGQTTSLHAVSALLSLPSSTLRDACARARSSAYSPRLQFKALELCLSVSLDRVPSTQLADDPPVSNSLMAAIKRSQANQRRQPENFHLYHQIPQQSSISCVKVELQHLLLSILDDPVVSRVFGEAGFRSSEIKLAIVRPLPNVLRYSRSRGPPLFLCNLSEYSDPGRHGFTFPFSVFPGFCGGDENCRRIAEVMDRNKGRNPLLVGVCAYSALQSFTEAIEKRKDSVLPVELSGLNTICIENDVSEFVTENFDKGSLSLKFEEVSSKVKQSLGPGLVVNFGDLNAFVGGDDGAGEAAGYVVDQLTRLLEFHAGRVWLIGAAASDESYRKFLRKFPSVEKDWDLQLLPITSLRPSSMSESYPKSSLLGSFIPFGGFFSTPSDSKVPLSSSYRCVPHSLQCNEKCKPEVIAVSKGCCTTSVADHYKSSSPSWLQMTELGSNMGLDMKIKDDGAVLNAKVIGVQKKGDNICQHLQHTQLFPEANKFPTVLGFRFVEDKKENTDNHSSNNTDAASNETNCVKVDSCMSMDVLKIATLQSSNPFPVVSKAKNERLLWEQCKPPSKTEDLESGGLYSLPYSLSNSSVGDGSRTSPTSATSVTTDLGLGICFSPINNKPKKCIQKNVINLSRDISGNISNHPTQSSCFSSPDYGGQFDPRDLKTLLRALTERIGWQDEAIACCRAITEKRHRESLRTNIWLHFIGPDRFGKKKIALALAEIFYGGREQFICVDLSPLDGIIYTNTNLDCQEMNGHDIKFRGKTLLDYLAGELRKKPLSLVFLENVDKADVMARNSLSQAIRSGKLSDSHGREISINNAIFVTTSTSSKGTSLGRIRKKPSNFSEERILGAKCWPMQIRIEQTFVDTTKNQNMNALDTVRKEVSNPIFVNKRKLIIGNESLEQSEISEMAKRVHKGSSRYLDLNLPAEEYEACDSDEWNSEDSILENSNAWLQDFCDQVDETVVFKPFDFVALTEKVSREIKKCFSKIVGSDSLLEVDSKVMDQLLAAAYISDGSSVVEYWVERVLSRAFAEVPKRYSLTAHSVVKLASCEGLCFEELALGVCLPPRIILN
ncbi:protein SMAX1-LIKE 6 [Juglans microcarpa x Juglans regia]|uniref:protein SMAX1-LIKE 6 n=1 Tax=Juglans microcarpa x Juglans regia TaxID=2249226 RepID=UPI001B7DAE8A|nr:protein SMAX1-LIKE 6 [Juglans microcarpa x Juglans regia]